MTELTATFKGGKGFEEPWLVLRGETPAELIAGIKEAFSITDEMAGSLPLWEILTIANRIAHGEQVVATVLGATPVSVETGKVADSPAEETPKAEPEPDANPHAGLIAKLQGAETVDSLKKLWAANRDAFADDDVKAAYSARGKELQAAG